MSLGLVGRKVGMTQVYLEESGAGVPVTVVHAEPNRIVQVISGGYDAVQVTYGSKKIPHVGKKEGHKKPSSVLSKQMAGHFKKHGVKAGRGSCEFRLLAPNPEYTSGFEYGVDIFEKGQFVDVTGVSKGKGYAGAVQRHNFSTQDASHGNSVSHRAPGSIGQNQTPGKVFKGKKMSGHLGVDRCTVQNLEVVGVDKEKNLLLIKGAVPGFETSDVIVRHAVKKDKKET